ncbi:hypothetical protein AX774_g3307 [Zancudomyces culisetae]|uniref:Uncharacterized protein n=1 Tax=Zancudomyces culisetae TaxID=1213189 RepID=A0A1R1PQF9_ZANCU|nr:hypothetical protein AX774_g3307 [Zancudomyces culisetae]|eukprot:OMH83194.1 hypothetical protein AX774_g3307 [Zancudomyces culisetae]
MMTQTKSGTLIIDSSGKSHNNQLITFRKSRIVGRCTGWWRWNASKHQISKMSLINSNRKRPVGQLTYLLKHKYLCNKLNNTHTDCLLHQLFNRLLNIPRIRARQRTQQTQYLA